MGHYNYNSNLIFDFCFMNNCPWSEIRTTACNAEGSIRVNSGQGTNQIEVINYLVQGKLDWGKWQHFNFDFKQHVLYSSLDENGLKKM